MIDDNEDIDLNSINETKKRKGYILRIGNQHLFNFIYSMIILIKIILIHMKKFNF